MMGRESLFNATNANEPYLKLKGLLIACLIE